ncbi:hypothetical protein HY995_02865 [Candidatus Micrarchaeota archaeon]|nr:hypothetical protein [Candidatus Micrarchaeota archaeon]
METSSFDKNPGLRRGLLYSLTLLMLLAPIFLYLMSSSALSAQKNAQVVARVRGNELASFGDSLSQDVPRVLEIAGKRAVVAAGNYIYASGSPLQDAHANLSELATNGSLSSVNQSVMAGSSINEWAASVSRIGANRGLNVSINATRLDVTPSSAFELNLTSTLEVNITDVKEPVNISRTYVSSRIISVLGFEDPLYALHGLGFVHRVFARPSITPVWGNAALDAAFAQGGYLNTSLGPSVLDRFEGRLSLSDRYASMAGDQIGLESLVNSTEFSLRGLNFTANQSVADWQFFNATAIHGYAVTGSAYPNQRLDRMHNDTYGVTVDLNS